MNKTWNILLCDTSIDKCPATDFIFSSRREHQVKILHFLNLLGELGPNLKRPYADLLEGGVHELRIKLSGEQVRLLYFFCFEYYIVVFDVLHKHSDRVPEKHILSTLKYKQEIIGKLDESSFALKNADNPINILKNKLLDDEFKSVYDSKCNVCRKTVEIINKMQGDGLPELARRTGTTTAELEAFTDADHCSYELVAKLCDHLGIEKPIDCIKKNKE